MSAKQIFFITGTDTGVGKTLLAAFLLHHLRRGPGRTLAMKPFCSGGTGDVRLLQSLQPAELSDAEMNPFYFAQPVAPAAAGQGKIKLREVLKKINQIKAKCDQLIIEGSGGLLVPLSKDFLVADLIAALDCQVIVAARNRLGTINHTLLTVQALQSIGIRPERISVVLMAGGRTDISCRTNKKIMTDWLKPIPFFEIPFLGNQKFSAKRVEKSYPRVTKILTKLVAASKLC